MRKLCVFLLFPTLAFAATTNPPAPPKIVTLAVPANNAAFFEAAHAGINGLTSLKAIVALPEGFDPRKSWPVLLITAPSGSSAVQSLRGYTNVALAQGWVVVAVDGPKVSVEKDNSSFAWAMISALLEQLRRSWPESKRWPFACAGFSGGAKRAAMTGANMMHQGDNLIGVFMGGCNEDRATTGYNISRPGAAYLDVPMFLSNGSSDPIAGPQHGATVKQSMEQTGFRKIRFETFKGQHQLDTNHVRMALEWFRPPAVKGK